jgi:hypothetical protein
MSVKPITTSISSPRWCARAFASTWPKRNIRGFAKRVPRREEVEVESREIRERRRATS